MKQIKVIFLLCNFIVLIAQAQTILVRPLTDNQLPVQSRNDKSAEIDSHILGKQAVEMVASPESAVHLENYLNQTFVFLFSESEQFTVTFTEGELQNKILTLRGKVNGSDLLNVSMTIGDGSYLVTIDDYKQGRVYHLNGDLLNGNGLVKQIDSQRLRENQQHSGELEVIKTIGSGV